MNKSSTVILALVGLCAVIGCIRKNHGKNESVAPVIQFVGLTNGTVLQGPISLPFNVRPQDYDNVYFVVNEGHSPMGVDIQTNSDGYGVVRWLTQNFENGLYDVYLEAERGDRSFYGTTNSLVVSNLISFDSWPVCGTQMWVFARLAIPQAHWKVKVFDDRTNYIGHFVGTTTNGLINFIWDLKSHTGAHLTNESSFSLDYSFDPIGDEKAVVPHVHPDPMVAPSVYTDPIPKKIGPPD